MWEALAAVSPVEAVAAALGLACVLLYVRQNLWCWPVGLAQVTLYAWVFFDARLYSDAGLQVVWIVLQLYGWLHWLNGGPAGRDSLPVGRIGRVAAAACTVLVLALTAGLGTLTSLFGAALPYADAFATAMSLVAQFLIGRKILESWLVWIAVDVVSIAIYLDRALYVTAGLYVVFLGLAVRGYLVWRRAAPA